MPVWLYSEKIPFRPLKEIVFDTSISLDEGGLELQASVRNPDTVVGI
jgi:hypothetical protein